MRALAIISSLMLSAAACDASTVLDRIHSRDKINCGINNDTPGFSTPDRQGHFTGITPDLCRAIGAAILGDSKKVSFILAPAASDIPNLQVGNTDILTKANEYTLNRDSNLGIRNVVNWFIDYQAIAVRKKLNIKKIQDLQDATFCLVQGNGTEINLAAWMKIQGINYKVVTYSDGRIAQDAFLEGRCDALTQDRFLLVSGLQYRDIKGETEALEFNIADKIYGIAVSKGNQDLEDAIRWIWNWLLKAEELGITQDNIDERINNIEDPRIKRLFNTSDDYWRKIGLHPRWAYNVIKQVGNYGELYDKHFTNSIIKFPNRGSNRLLKDGGTLVPSNFW